jgi:non-ribosomal peptide synthetase component F
LFQVMFVAEEEAAGRGWEQPRDWSCEQERVETGTSKFELTLFVEEAAEGLRLTAEYNTTCLRESMERMLRHYRQLLESARG